MKRDRISAKRAFSMVELLVVIAIIGVIASILLPVLAKAKSRSYQAACLSNLHQIGTDFTLFLADNNDRFMDRRDLKTSLGYLPWTTWPPSDPRGGWAGLVLSNDFAKANIWVCPAMATTPLATVPQCSQAYMTNSAGVASVTYWLWRFDRPDDPVNIEDFWGKSTDKAISDLRLANDSTVGQPTGPADVELAVDPYFPSTTPTAPANLKGHTTHNGGRTRLFLDVHADYERDPRLQ